MSKEDLKKTTIDLYSRDEYKQIAEAIDESINAVFEQYTNEDVRDIRGHIEFNVKDKHTFQHIATYAIHGAEDHWYECMSVYYPKEHALCEIQIIAAIIDLNSVGSGIVAREFVRRIAKELDARMPHGSQVENAFLCTLRSMIKNETLAFSRNSAYSAAEDVGVCDYRLVDIALDGLIKEGVLEPLGGQAYRLSSRALAEALA